MNAQSKPYKIPRQQAFMKLIFTLLQNKKNERKTNFIKLPQGMNAAMHIRIIGGVVLL